jgi:polyphosphate kinase 2 (PPK2 family)
MGFCTGSELAQFYRECAPLEHIFVNAGIKITKFWFNVSREEQAKRFNKRQTDPLKTGKMSAVDLASLDKWDSYTLAYDQMLMATSTKECPWVIVDSNNKDKARIAAMQYVLLTNDYLGKDLKAIGEIDKNILTVSE